jgi:hypothetical protein
MNFSLLSDHEEGTGGETVFPQLAWSDKYKQYARSEYFNRSDGLIF